MRTTGRVDLGGRLPSPRTDPGVRVKCTRLVHLWLRYAARQAVDHASTGKTGELLQASELGPCHLAVSAPPRKPVTPNPARCLPEFQETVEVPNDPVVPVVAPQLLRELLVLFLERKVQILSTPFRQRG